MKREQRLESRDKNRAISDQALSWILKWLREWIWAVLEWKNVALEKALEFTKVEERDNRRNAIRRPFNNHILQRGVRTISSWVDFLWSAMIWTADVINNIQWEIHDIFTWKSTTRWIVTSWVRWIADVVFRKWIRDTIRNSLIMNQELNRDFNLASNRIAT